MGCEGTRRRKGGQARRPRAISGQWAYWPVSGNRKKRDDWGAGGDPIGAVLVPAVAPRFKPFRRSLRAGARVPQASKILRAAQARAPRPGVPDQAALPLILLVLFFHRKALPVTIPTAVESHSEKGTGERSPRRDFRQAVPVVTKAPDKTHIPGVCITFLGFSGRASIADFRELRQHIVLFASPKEKDFAVK